MDANQPGDSEYSPAAMVQQLITVQILAITNIDLPNGTVSTAYSTTLTAIGGNPPYTWKVTSGSLP